MERDGGAGGGRDGLGFAAGPGGGEEIAGASVGLRFSF